MARKRTHGKDHKVTLVSLNNLAWCRLEAEAASPRQDFTRLIHSWTDATDWKHHWARLGLALCDALDGQGFAVAEQVIADLSELLGSEHDRVAKARKRLNDVR